MKHCPTTRRSRSRLAFCMFSPTRCVVVFDRLASSPAPAGLPGIRPTRPDRPPPRLRPHRGGRPDPHRRLAPRRSSRRAPGARCGRRPAPPARWRCSALVHGGKIAATRVRSRGCASRAAMDEDAGSGQEGRRDCGLAWTRHRGFRLKRDVSNPPQSSTTVKDRLLAEGQRLAGPERAMTISGRAARATPRPRDRPLRKSA